MSRSIATALGLLSLACALSSCSRSPADATDAGAKVVAAAAPAADACDKLRARVAACMANMKQGHLELEFDPSTLTDPAQCAQIDSKFGLLAATVRCEQ